MMQVKNAEFLTISNSPLKRLIFLFYNNIYSRNVLHQCPPTHPKYLCWAYVEAANFARRYCDEAQRFYQRKMANKNNIVATKALSNKICRASYYVMRDQVPWEVDRVFK